MIFVDDAIRWTVLAVTEFKTWEALEQCIRRNWLAHFGMPKKFVSDKESALANESFAVYCERLGVERELMLASEEHSRLGILDRRVQLVRMFMPRLADALAQHSVTLEPADVAAECQLCINTLIAHNGTSSYLCLYGVLPNAIHHDEDISCTADQEMLLPFYQHQLVRARSIQTFQESLLHARIVRAKHGRTRTEVTQDYTIGQSVDSFRKPLKKDLIGWRGPCSIIHVGQDAMSQ